MFSSLILLLFHQDLIKKRTNYQSINQLFNDLKEDINGKSLWHLKWGLWIFWTRFFNAQLPPSDLQGPNFFNSMQFSEILVNKLGSLMVYSHWTGRDRDLYRDQMESIVPCRNVHTGQSCSLYRPHSRSRVMWISHKVVIPSNGKF